MDKIYGLISGVLCCTYHGCGGYLLYWSEKDEKTINVKIAKVETTVDSENIEAAQNALGKEVTTEGDRISMADVRSFKL